MIKILDLKNKLLDKSAKDTILTLISNASSQVLSFFVTIMVSKSLSVTNFGLYSVINSVTSFITDLADLGMNSSLTRFVSECHAQNLVRQENKIISYTIRKKIVSLLFVLVLLFLFSRPIAKYIFHDEQLYYYVIFIFVSSGFSLLVGALRAVLQGRREFHKFSLVVVMWNLIWAGVIFLFYFLGKLSVLSSLLAGIISGSVNLFLCVKLTDLKLSKLLNCTDLEASYKRQLNNFSNWMIVWSVFSILQSKADVFLLATLTTKAEVSYYEIASKIIKPVLMVIASYSQVLNPQFASIDRNKLHDKIIEIRKFIFILSGFVIIFLIMVGPILNFIWGIKYAKSIIPAQMLLIAIIFYAWTVPFNSALYALNKPHIFTIAALAGLVVTIIGDILLLPKYGAIGASITYIFAQIIGLVIAFSGYKKYNFKEG